MKMQCMAKMSALLVLFLGATACGDKAAKGPGLSSMGGASGMGMQAGERSPGSAPSSLAECTSCTAELKINHIECPERVSDQQTTYCLVEISNLSHVAATDFEMHLFFSDDSSDYAETQIGSCEIDSLGAFETKYALCSGIVPDDHPRGYGTIQAVVDGGEKVDELEDDNTNRLASGQKIISFEETDAEIYVTGLDCPSPFGDVTGFACEVTVANLSQIDVPVEATLNLMSETGSFVRRELASCGLSELKSGEMTTLRCEAGPDVSLAGTGGPVLIGFEAHIPYDLDIDELDGQNNEVQKEVWVTGDDEQALAITELKCPSHAPRGSDLSCRVTVANIGTEASRASNAQLSIESLYGARWREEFTPCQLPALEPGVSTELTCLLALRSDQPSQQRYQFVAELEAPPTEEEDSDEDLPPGYRATSQLTLEGQSTGFDPQIIGGECGSLETGKPFECTYELRNNGLGVGDFDAELIFSYDSQFGQDDETQGTCDLSSLEAEEEASIRCAGDLELGGGRRIALRLDIEHQVQIWTDGIAYAL